MVKKRNVLVLGSFHFCSSSCAAGTAAVSSSVAEVGELDGGELLGALSSPIRDDFSSRTILSTMAIQRKSGGARIEGEDA